MAVGFCVGAGVQPWEVAAGGKWVLLPCAMSTGRRLPVPSSPSTSWDREARVGPTTFSAPSYARSEDIEAYRGPYTHRAPKRTCARGRGFAPGPKNRQGLAGRSNIVVVGRRAGCPAPRRRPKVPPGARPGRPSKPGRRGYKPGAGKRRYVEQLYLGEQTTARREFWRTGPAPGRDQAFGGPCLPRCFPWVSKGPGAFCLVFLAENAGRRRGPGPWVRTTEIASRGGPSGARELKNGGTLTGSALPLSPKLANRSWFVLTGNGRPWGPFESAR